MITAIELEESIASTYIFGVVVYKFGYGQELGPIILLPIYKVTKVCIYGTILPFDLTVSLGIKSGGKLLLNT